VLLDEFIEYGPLNMYEFRYMSAGHGQLRDATFDFRIGARTEKLVPFDSHLMARMLVICFSRNFSLVLSFGSTCPSAKSTIGETVN
jgi:hypothetical protein